MAGMVRTKTCLRCLFRTSSDIQQLKLAPRNAHLTLRSASTLTRRLLPVSTQQLRAIPLRLQLVKTVTTQQKKPPGSGGPITWKFVAVLAVLGGIYVVVFRYKKKSIEKERKIESTKSYGMASLGGDWTLTDHTGKTVTNKDFSGKWTMLYFGFTHCPDICPDELEKLAEVVDLIDFSPKLIGLTGTKAQVEEICRVYRVYFHEGPRDEDNDYIVSKVHNYNVA
ncbi:hypothetical protein KUTeg_001516 [Tegillarca granosa]|uniref:Uncharacterized protein n=1 Tax=Tegillarca granosa TaxID=220873 RepID=A0ABQ9FRM5_TEGGR|nr:hypothetical protein KUTeg_001516 [Tegillarca granosa]